MVMRTGSRLVATAFLTMLIVLTLLIAACASVPDALARLERTTLEGTWAWPTFLHVYDAANGNLVAQWLSNAGPIGWIEDPETLVFVGSTSHGLELVAGDPSDATTYRLASLVSHARGSVRVADQPDMLIFKDGDEVRRLPLPGRLVRAAYQPGFEYSVGPLRVEDEEVWIGETRLLTNRGLLFDLLASPSGRWVAVPEVQAYGSRIEYHLSTTEDAPQVNVVPDDAPLSETPSPSALSPSGTRVAQVEPLRTRLKYRDGVLIWHNQNGGDPAVWWSPDGSYFAYFSWDSRLMVADMDGQVRVAVRGLRPIWFRGWNDDAITWRIWAVGGHP